jgi:hypothetical protein
MDKTEQESQVGRKYSLLKFCLNERARRLWAATEALSLGQGGQSIVSRATGISIKTIRFGIEELQSGNKEKSSERVRREGGGRKTLALRDLP